MEGFPEGVMFRMRIQIDKELGKGCTPGLAVELTGTQEMEMTMTSQPRWP